MEHAGGCFCTLGFFLKLFLKLFVHLYYLFPYWNKTISVDIPVLANICSGSTIAQHVKEQCLTVHMFNLNHVAP